MTLKQTAQEAIEMIATEDLSKWASRHDKVVIDALKAAIHAEQAQAVESVGRVTAHRGSVAIEWTDKCPSVGTSLFTHPAPPPAGERTKVGDSQFESWYAETKIQQMGTKQRYREAYEAGLNEAQQVTVPEMIALLEWITAYVEALPASATSAHKWAAISRQALKALQPPQGDKP